MIRKEGKKTILYSSDGKRKLGEHSSKKAAIAQEVAIKYSQARAAGKKKP